MHLINGKNFSKIISGDSLALSIQLLVLICSHIETLYQLSNYNEALFFSGKFSLFSRTPLMCDV